MAVTDESLLCTKMTSVSLLRIRAGMCVVDEDDAVALLLSPERGVIGLCDRPLGEDAV